ncbi:XK protein [Fasciola gigantica]|nr:XK protein [Fasciola gigantica]
MGSRYTATSLGTTNVESVVSVVDDLVSDRAIWRKLFCIVLCTLFVINAWAVISLHVINFTNETVLEVTVSVVVLLVGQYIACGLVDGFIYWRRWRQTSQKVHSKFQEENKEAWICMRITLNLLGFAPVAR